MAIVLSANHTVTVENSNNSGSTPSNHFEAIYEASVTYIDSKTLVLAGSSGAVSAWPSAAGVTGYLNFKIYAKYTPSTPATTTLVIDGVTVTMGVEGAFRAQTSLTINNTSTASTEYQIVAWQ